MSMGMWQYTGQERPSFAQEPGLNQESVWDYPRPPALEPSDEEVVVMSAGEVIARTKRSLRMLETASPPTYYIPEAEIVWAQLTAVGQPSFCEWKGQATYFSLAGDGSKQPVAWIYAQPAEAYGLIDRHVSFYPGKVACFVDGERVQPQPGQFYGGWITARVVGPFKGESGTSGW